MDKLWAILIGSILLDAAIHVQPVLFTCLALAPWHQWVVHLDQLYEVLITLLTPYFVILSLRLCVCSCWRKYKLAVLI